MTAYIKLSTLEYPLYEGDIRLEYPEITDDQTGELFPCPDTYAKVIESVVPTYDDKTQTIHQISPVNVNGLWYTSWETYTYTEEEIKARDDMFNSKPKNQEDLNKPGTEPDVIG